MYFLSTTFPNAPAHPPPPQPILFHQSLKQAKNKSLNDLEQYTRGDCTEICGIPLPEEPSEEDANDIVIQLKEKIGVPMERNDISISHRIPSARDSVEPAIIVKFVRREVRENFYRARKRLKSVSIADLGFSEAKRSTSMNV